MLNSPENTTQKLEEMLAKIKETARNNQEKSEGSEIQNSIEEIKNKTQNQVSEILSEQKNYKNLSWKKEINIWNNKFIFELFLNDSKIEDKKLWFLLKIRKDSHKKFSKFEISATFDRIEEKKDYLTENVVKILHWFHFERIIKTDNNNWWPVFLAWKWDYWDNKIFSFNYFLRFFSSKLADDILYKEIKQYFKEFLTQNKNSD